MELLIFERLCITVERMGLTPLSTENQSDNLSLTCTLFRTLEYIAFREQLLYGYCDVCVHKRTS